MYEKVSTDMNFIEREKAVEKFWKDNQIFEKSMEAREGCPTYTFYDGPPTANGKPHIGHVLTRVIKLVTDGLCCFFSVQRTTDRNAKHMDSGTNPTGYKRLKHLFDILAKFMCYMFNGKIILVDSIRYEVVCYTCLVEQSSCIGFIYFHCLRSCCIDNQSYIAR